jgi:hypothetical protein
MLINFNNNVQFKGIFIKNGGVEYVNSEGGQQALSKLNQAKQEYANSKWNLYVTNEGYTLESPNKKTYKGPFSVKRLLKTGEARKNTTTLVIRMDKANRVKYSIYIPNKADLTKWYRQIKLGKGLDKMLNILTVLEKSFK